MPVKKTGEKTSVKTSVGSFVFCKFCVLAALFGAISAILFFVPLVQIPLSPPSGGLLVVATIKGKVKNAFPFLLLLIAAPPHGSDFGRMK